MNQIKKWSDGAQAGTMIWIKRHTDSFYKLAFLITILGLLFFIFSRSILGDDSPIVDGGVGYQTRQTLNNNQVQVVQRGYNEQKQYLQVFFDVRQKETGGKTTFDAKVVDTGRQKAVPAKIEKITDRYYVLNVQHVPQGWHHLAVVYGFVTKSQPLIDRTFNDEDADQVLSHQATTSDKVVQQVYRIDYRKMRSSDHLTLLSHDAYVAQYVRLELAQNKKAIQKIESDMTQARSDIRQYEARIDDLKRQQKTAVGSQVDEITTNIKTVQDNIAGSNKTIDNGQDAVDSYQKMNEKLRKQL